MCSLLDKSDSAGDFIDGTNHLFQSVVPTGLSTNTTTMFCGINLMKLNRYNFLRPGIDHRWVA